VVICLPVNSVPLPFVVRHRPVANPPVNMGKPHCQIEDINELHHQVELFDAVKQHIIIAMEFNQVIRQFNQQDGAIIRPLRNSIGQIPPNFPANRNDYRQLDQDAITELLSFYGLDTQLALENHLGLN